MLINNCLFTACKQDSGKYMVKAINDAGETQSIADFVILEPTPDGLIEMTKTVTKETIEGQRVSYFLCFFFFLISFKTIRQNFIKLEMNT